MYHIIRHTFGGYSDYTQYCDVTNQCTEWNITLQPFTKTRKFLGNFAHKQDSGNVIASSPTPFTKETHPEYFI